MFVRRSLAHIYSNFPQRRIWARLDECFAVKDGAGRTRGVCEVLFLTIQGGKHEGIDEFASAAPQP